jgi:hypothetical protein
VVVVEVLVDVDVAYGIAVTGTMYLKLDRGKGGYLTYFYHRSHQATRQLAVSEGEIQVSKFVQV